MEPHSQIQMQKIGEIGTEAPQTAQSAATGIQFNWDKLTLSNTKKPGTVVRLYSPVN